MNFGQIKNQIKRNLGYLQTKPTGETDDSVSLYVNKEYQGLSGKDDWNWWLGRMQYSVYVGQTGISLPRDFSNVLMLRDSKKCPIGIQPTKEQAAYCDLHAAALNRTAAPDFVYPFNFYATGTVALAQGGTTVTLTGGTLPADIVGRSFLLQDDPEQFVIATRTDDTHFVVDHARIGATVAASAYWIDKAGTRRYKFEPVVSEADTWTLYYFFVPPPLLADADEPLLPEEFHSYLIEAPREFMYLNAEERAQLFQAGNLESAKILSDMRSRNRAQLSAMLMSIEAYA